jgi:alpha-1,3-rhamnosyl/mannosyltransferase
MHGINPIRPDDMRVALNARILLAPRTGIGHYVAELIRSLQIQNDLELHLFYGRKWGKELTETSLPGYSRLAAIAKRVIPGAYHLRRLIEQHRFDAGLKSSSADIYHEPSLWPLDFDGPMVMTLHDLTHLHFPQTQPRNRLAEIERRVDKGIENAKRILVDSAFMGREVVDHFGLKPEKVVVAPLGSSSAFAPRDEADTNDTLQNHALRYRQYLLCVATLEPRKNLRLVLRAYALLPEKLRSQYPLLLVGMSGWGKNAFADDLRKALATGHVRLAGYLEQEELINIIASARALIYPSLYEGFGLPVLEAMACGTPVIISDRASLPEIAGKAGIVVSAEDAFQLREAMQTIIEDNNEWLFRRQAGLTRAKDFSWDRCAMITAQTYRDALSD